MDRLNSVLKKKGKTMSYLAKRMNIKRESVYSRIKNPKLSTIIEIARYLDIEPVQLIGTTKDFQHLYNEYGEWEGVHRKCKD